MNKMNCVTVRNQKHLRLLKYGEIHYRKTGTKYNYTNFDTRILYLFRYLKLSRFNDLTIPVAKLKDIYASCKLRKVYLVGETYIGKFKNFFSQKIIYYQVI